GAVRLLASCTSNQTQPQTAPAGLIEQLGHLIRQLHLQGPDDLGRQPRCRHSQDTKEDTKEAAMTLEDCYGLLFLASFALVVGVGVGVFARGATGFAALLVVALGSVIAVLLSLATTAAPKEPDNA